MQHEKHSGKSSAAASENGKGAKGTTTKNTPAQITAQNKIR